MKVVGVMQARMGSKRLPGKIMLPLGGTTLLDVVVRRIRSHCGSISEWWLATTTSPVDDVTAVWGQSLGLKVFRGSETDVLSRFVAIAKAASADWIARVTADDPFMHGNTIDQLLATAKEGGADYVGPNLGHYPAGFVPELISRDALLTTDAESSGSPRLREHVTLWWREHRHAIPLPPFLTPARPDWNWTVDTPEDYQRIGQAFRMLGEEWPLINYAQLVALFDQHVHLMRRDASVKVETSWGHLRSVSGAR
jgi:spore coat polysaccharide biosynthesis protein SpsF